METTAKGSFEIKMTPQPWADSTTEAVVEHGFGRFLLDKKYSGDLEGAAQGQMLSVGSGASGTSGVYVAIEKITGSLNGRKGSFVLYHTGIMSHGVPNLTIAVSPGSGTGDLEGLEGSLLIERVDARHGYTFTYTIAKKD